MKKQNGFQLFKKVISSYKPGDYIHRLDVYIKLKDVIKKETIDSLFYKYKRAGYVFTAITLDHCCYNQVFVRSHKPISENFTTINLNEEVEKIKSFDFFDKFHTNVRYAYMLIYKDLYQTNMIKKSKIEDFKMIEFIKILKDITLIEENTFNYSLNLINMTEFNMSFNTFVELFFYKQYIPENYVKKTLPI